MLFGELFSALSTGTLRFIPGILLLASLAAPAGAASPLPVNKLVNKEVSLTGTEQIDYFPFEQSNSWRFSGHTSGVDDGEIYEESYFNTMRVTGTRLIDAVTATVFYESNPDNSGMHDEMYLVKNAEGITNYGSASDAGLDAQLIPYLELRFPLVAGDKFEQLNKTGLDLGIDFDGDGVSETINVRSILTVAGFEAVAVPAGSFVACVKLVRQMDMTVILSASGRQVSGTDSGTLWLAPGVGPVKKTETVTVVDSSGIIANSSETTVEVLTEYLVNGQGTGINNGLLVLANQPSNLVAKNNALYWNDAIAGTVKHSVKGVEEATPLTSRLGDPVALAAEGDELFWIEEQGGFAASGCAGQGVVRVLKKLAADGSTVTELARGDACGGGTTVLVVDDTHVYWVNSLGSPNSYTIRKVPLNGGAAVTLASSYKQIVGLAADENYIYWEEEGMGPITLPDGPEGSAISRVAKSGGTPELLVNGALNGLITQPPEGYIPGSWFPRGGLVVQGGILFFSDTNFHDRYRLFKLPVNGGDLNVLTTETSNYESHYILRMAADNSHVIWLDQSGVKALLLTGGIPQTLAATALEPLDLQIANSRVYWTETSGPAHGETGTLKSVALTGGLVETLVQGGDAPRRLAVTDSQLYWSEGGPIGQIEGFARIARLPLPGGNPTTVLLNVGSGAFAVDDNNLYIGNGFRIYRLPTGGGQAETLVRGDDTIHSIASDGSFVYWLEGPFAVVRRIPVGGGEAVTLFSSTVSPLSGPAGPIRVHGGYVYWMSHYSSISRIPAAGGPVEIIINNDNLFLSDFVTDGTHVYFSDQDSGAISRVPVNGGSSVFLANASAFSSISLALDSRYLYWIDQQWLGKVSLTGGPILLRNPVNNATDPPASISAAGGSLYWTETATGAVMKMTPDVLPGNCNGDSFVTIDEVQSAINMFLGIKGVEECVDNDKSGGVSIAEVQKVINGFLGL